jgi:hypothetical protein
MAKRRIKRDRRGRFARTASSSAGRHVGKASPPRPTAGRSVSPKTKRRAAVAGSVVIASAVAVHQARNPASRTRSTVAQRRIAAAYVQRAAADHRRLTSIRASAFPTTAVAGRSFDADAARREAQRLTSGYRAQAKRVRRTR